MSTAIWLMQPRGSNIIPSLDQLSQYLSALTFPITTEDNLMLKLEGDTLTKLQRLVCALYSMIEALCTYL